MQTKKAFCKYFSATTKHEIVVDPNPIVMGGGHHAVYVNCIEFFPLCEHSSGGMCVYVWVLCLWEWVYCWCGCVKSYLSDCFEQSKSLRLHTL